MEINLNLEQMLLNSLISAVVGAGILYFTAYIKEKGRSKALKENISLLEEEKQSITSKYQSSIEELKKTHQLDIEKRKHQYESKKTQYYQFMQELDGFQGVLHRVLSEEFSQIMLTYYASINSLTLQTKEELQIEFNNKAQAALADIKRQEAKLYSQLNAFKLSATAVIITLLEDLMFDIQSSEKILVDILEYIGSERFQLSQDLPNTVLLMSDDNNTNLTETREKLMIALRLDLDEI